MVVTYRGTYRYVIVVCQLGTYSLKKKVERIIRSRSRYLNEASLIALPVLHRIQSQIWGWWHGTSTINFYQPCPCSLGFWIDWGPLVYPIMCVVDGLQSAAQHGWLLLGGLAKIGMGHGHTSCCAKLKKPLNWGRSSETTGTSYNLEPLPDSDATSVVWTCQCCSCHLKRTRQSLSLLGIFKTFRSPSFVRSMYIKVLHDESSTLVQCLSSIALVIEVRVE